MTTQTDYAYLFIKNRILEGTFKPAQKLNESQLSEDIGVSRNTIKKAFLMLESENLLKIEKNKGATIKSFTLEEILNYLEIRAVLEAVIIKSTVKNITNEQLKQLETTFNKMKEYIFNHQLEEYSKQNQLFHSIIYEASSNKQAVEIVNIIKTQLNRYHFKTIFVPGRNDQSLKEHTAIFNSIKNGNVEEAINSIQEHILNVGEVIKSNYLLLQ